MADERAVRVLELGDLTVIGLVGDHAGTAPWIGEQLRRVLRRDPATIVVDCSLLRCLGADEIAVLGDAVERVQDRNGRLVLRQPAGPARDALAAAGLLDAVEIEA